MSYGSDSDDSVENDVKISKRPNEPSIGQRSHSKIKPSSSNEKFVGNKNSSLSTVNEKQNRKIPSASMYSKIESNAKAPIKMTFMKKVSIH